VQLAVSKGVKAQDIVTVASEALALDTGGTAAVTDVENYVIGKINGTSLPAADKDALAIVVDSVGVVAQNEVTNIAGTTPTVAIADVLNKIIQAAKAQLGVPSPAVSTTAQGTVS
jgi:hypothetical protein